MSFLKKYFIIAVTAAIATVALPFIADAQRNLAGEKTEYRQLQASQQYISVLMQSGEVVSMPLEEYLIGVVSAEMPANFEKETLKAQAVAARTYATLRRDRGVGRKDHGGADVCTDYTHCKAYISTTDALVNWGKDGKKNLKKISDAVNSTAGEVIVYENEVIDAVFHAASSGHTESSADVWGGERPYLTSVYSEGDLVDNSYTSVVTLKASELKAAILQAAPDAKFSDDPKDWVKDITHTEGGAVDQITIGGVKFDGTKIRELFALRSAAFTITLDAGAFVFTVKGYGHGVGMSQNGANYMAKHGKNYIEILKWYYKGVEIVDYEELNS